MRMSFRPEKFVSTNFEVEKSCRFGLSTNSKISALCHAWIRLFLVPVLMNLYIIFVILSEARNERSRRIPHNFDGLLRRNYGGSFRSQSSLQDDVVLIQDLCKRSSAALLEMTHSVIHLTTPRRYKFHWRDRFWSLAQRWCFDRF